MHSLNNKIRQMFSSERGKSIYAKITGTITKNSMAEKIYSGTLVGFSGGADSCLLLCFLYEHLLRGDKSFAIHCVHINHMIRGEEATRDAEFCRSFTEALSIPISISEADVPALARSMSIGIEEAARNARYSIFEDIIQGRDDLSCISVAHNATDNLETVLFNMMRGAGVSGMCGIRPIRDNVVRPLIEISKTEIRSLLNEFEIPYVIDSTNLSQEYTRNYIRQSVVPTLSPLSQNPEASVTKMTEKLRSALDYIDTAADGVIDKINGKYIDLSILKNLHDAVLSRVITKLVFKYCGAFPEEKHIISIKDSLNKDNFSVSLPGGYDFVCQRGKCFFRDNNKKAPDDIILRLERGENKIEGTNLVVCVGENDNFSSNVYKSATQVRILSDIIDSGVILRLKKDGDAYCYSGITHKLKKVFNDNGIPPVERARIPVLCDSNGIVYVPGLPVRDGAHVRGEKMIKITFYFSEPEEGSIELFDAASRTSIAISSKERHSNTQ